MNGGCLPLRWAGSRTPALCTHTHWDTWQNGALISVSVLFLLWQVKISAMKRVCKAIRNKNIKQMHVWMIAYYHRRMVKPAKLLISRLKRTCDHLSNKIWAWTAKPLVPHEVPNNSQALEVSVIVQWCLNRPCSQQTFWLIKKGKAQVEFKTWMVAAFHLDELVQGLRHCARTLTETLDRMGPSSALVCFFCFGRSKFLPWKGSVKP